MPLPDSLLNPIDDDPCEECGAGWHTTRRCPVRRQQDAIEQMEERRSEHCGTD